MADSAVQQNLVAKNAEYASKFDKGDLGTPPAKNCIVGKYTPIHPLFRSMASSSNLTAKVTCMDARIDPAAAYGIDVGDAHVIRNAGGHVRPALRDILISQQLLGTKELLVIKHTRCGMLSFKNEDALAIVEKNLGVQARANLEGFDFHTITNLEEAVKSDVKWLKDCSYVPRDVLVSGWIYDVATGKVKKVV
jgi:carbonic anhydrase